MQRMERVAFGVLIFGIIAALLATILMLLTAKIPEIHAYDGARLVRRMAGGMV